MRIITTMAAVLMAAAGLSAQDNSISIDTRQSLGEASPYIYGQFIEYMGRDIEGGIYDPNSPLSDTNGIRQDVLAQMVNILAPIMVDEKTSIRQTVFYPLKEYRANTLGEVVKTETVSRPLDGRLEALNAVTTIVGKRQQNLEIPAASVLFVRL